MTQARSLVLLFLFLCLSLAAPATVWAQADSPRQLLARMAQANRTLDYRGVFTHEYAGALASLAIVHAVRDGREYQKIVHLNGTPREWLRVNSLACRRAADQLLAATHLAGAEVERHYRLWVKGEDRVAGRPVRILHAIPEDPYRYGQVLALDRETGLLLQALVVDAEGKVLERFQFAEIQYGLAPEEIAALAEERAAEEPCGALAEDEQLVGWLPPGFRLLGRREAERELALLFGDGLAFFSVVIGAPLPTGPRPLFLRRGATGVWFAEVGGEIPVGVVGEVPARTLERVAATVRVAGVRP
ncbi:MAG: sigma factor AlgU regulatory protein MucB [Porticoccaceae bacterium]|nr:MAG: sigma factor AlgU regulatory protein MucB [Porticoccaceae bacterium]